MPRKKRNGSRGSSPEKPAQGGFPSQQYCPDDGSQAWTVVGDDKSSNRSSQRDITDADQTFHNLQDMFKDTIEPEVIHMVLMECDWKVNEALEKLFMLTNESDNNRGSGRLSMESVAQTLNVMVNKSGDAPPGQNSSEPIPIKYPGDSSSYGGEQPTSPGYIPVLSPKTPAGVSMELGDIFPGGHVHNEGDLQSAMEAFGAFANNTMCLPTYDPSKPAPGYVAMDRRDQGFRVSESMNVPPPVNVSYQQSGPPMPFNVSQGDHKFNHASEIDPKARAFGDKQDYGQFMPQNFNPMAGFTVPPSGFQEQPNLFGNDSTASNPATNPESLNPNCNSKIANFPDLPVIMHPSGYMVRKGHRKQTLSLDPAEREALENLIGDVIITGVDEGVIDSEDSSSSESSDEMGSGSTAPRPKLASMSQLQNPKSPLDKRDGKDPASNGHFKEKKGKQEKGKDGGKVYPAQLKVAVKHMKSLPPRFLRRLQTAQKQLDAAGVPKKPDAQAEGALLESLSPMRPGEGLSGQGKMDSPSQDMRDRGRSKEDHLKEKKKKIRNLLDDLDQYTDETTVVIEEKAEEDKCRGESDKSPGIALSSPHGSDGVQTTDDLFQHLSLTNHSPAPNLPISGASVLNCAELEREMFQPDSMDPSHKMSPMAQRMANLQASHHNIMPLSTMAKDTLATYYYPGQQPNAYMTGPDKPHSQFSVDAPEFVPKSFLPMNNVTSSQPLMSDLNSMPLHSMSHNLPAGITPEQLQLLQQQAFLQKTSNPFPGQLGRMSPHVVTGMDRVSPHVVPASSGAQMNAEQMGRNSPHQPPPYLVPRLGQSMASQVSVPPPPQHSSALGLVPGFTGLLPPTSAPSNNRLPMAFAPPVTHCAPMGPPPPFLPHQGYGIWGTQGQEAMMGGAPDQIMAAHSQKMYHGNVNRHPGVKENKRPPHHNSPHLGPKVRHPGLNQNSESNDGAFLNLNNNAQVTSHNSASAKARVEQLMAEGHKVMVILRGLPGSGKSTIAKEIQYSGVVLSADDFFLDMNGLYQYDQSKIGLAHEWNQKRAKEAVEQSVNPIVIDNTNIQGWEMKYYVSLARSNGYTVELIEPDTPWKFNAKELAKRNMHGVSLDVIVKMMGRYDRYVTLHSILGPQSILNTAAAALGDSSHQPMKQPITTNATLDSGLTQEEPKKHRRRRRRRKKKKVDDGEKREAGDGEDEDLSDDDKATGKKPTEDKATGDKTTDDKAMADKITDDKATDDKITDDKAVADKTTDDKAVGDKTTDDKAVGDKTTDDKAVGDKTADDQATERNLDDKAIGDKTAEDETKVVMTTNDTTTPEGKDETVDEKTVTEKTTDKVTSEGGDTTTLEVSGEAMTEIILDIDDKTAHLQEDGNSTIHKGSDMPKQQESSDKLIQLEGSERTRSQESYNSTIHEGSDKPRQLETSDKPIVLEGSRKTASVGSDDSIKVGSDKSRQLEINDKVHTEGNDKSPLIEGSRKTTSDDCNTSTFQEDGNNSTIHVSSDKPTQLEGSDKPTAKGNDQPTGLKDSVSPHKQDPTATLSRDKEAILHCKSDSTVDIMPVSKPNHSETIDDSRTTYENETQVVTANLHQDTSGAEAETAQSDTARDISTFIFTKEWRKSQRRSGVPRKISVSIGHLKEALLLELAACESEMQDHSDDSDVVEDKPVATEFDDFSTAMQGGIARHRQMSESMQNLGGTKEKEGVTENMTQEASSHGNIERDPQSTESDRNKTDELVGTPSVEASPRSKRGRNRKANQEEAIRLLDSHTKVQLQGQSWRIPDFPTNQQGFFSVSVTAGDLSNFKDSQTNTCPGDFKVLNDVSHTSLPGFKILLGVPRDLGEREEVGGSEGVPCGKIMVDHSTSTDDLQQTGHQDKVDFLKSCFGAVPDDDLHDILTQCSGDLDWAVNILLDAGYDTTDGDRVGLLSVADGEKNEREECCLGKQATSPTSLVSMCQDALHSQQAPVTLCDIECDEDDLSHPNVNRDIHPAQITPFNTTDVAITDQKSDISEQTESVSSCGTETGNPVEPPAFNLQLSQAQAHTLISMFGPVGFSIAPELLCHDDLMVAIDDDTARKLHSSWASSLQEKYTKEDDIMAAMVLKDEQLARRLQEEEDQVLARESSGRLMPPATTLRPSPHPPASLQEIMEEEMALEASKQQFLDEQARASGQEYAMATEIKRQQLLDMFPAFDTSLLDDIFKAHQYNMESTIQTVQEAHGQAMLVSPKKHRAEHLSSFDSPTQGSASPKRRRRPYAASDSDEQVEQWDDRDWRQEASHYYQLRQESYQKAQEAYGRGMRDVASYFSQQANLYTDKLRLANRRAAQVILAKAKEKYGSGNVLDLHGLHVSEAISVLQTSLARRETEPGQRTDRQRHVCVITGRGHHSRGGVARIRPAVLQYLKKHKYSFTEPQAGLLRISLPQPR